MSTPYTVSIYPGDDDRKFWTLETLVLAVEEHAAAGRHVRAFGADHEWSSDKGMHDDLTEDERDAVEDAIARGRATRNERLAAKGA